MRAGARGESSLAKLGFTLIEMLVVLAIVALLGGVLAPQVLGRLGEGEAAVLAGDLDSIGEAIRSYRSHVRRYPSTLENLMVPPDADAGDACGGMLPASFRDGWRGPYLSRSVAGAGLRSGNATIRNSLTREPGGASVMAHGTLYLTVDEVDRGVAERLDEALDGAVDFADGSLRWAAQGDDRGTLSYGLAIRGC